METTNDISTTPTQQLPRTLAALAYELFVSLEALQVKLRRMTRTVNTDNLSDDDLKAILTDYASLSGRRTPETVAAAVKMLEQLGVVVDGQAPLVNSVARLPRYTDPKPEPKPEPKPDIKPGPKPEPDPDPKLKPQPLPAAGPASSDSRIVRFFRSDTFLFVVFMGAMIWQVLNTKEVVLWADKESNFAEALLYAGSIQFTALLMTLHRGGRVYLLIFAVLEFGVNMIHYRPWDKEGTGIDVWVIDILLSFAIAFSIYSYSEIFTTKRQ